jgi:hypothetical protein
VRPEGLCQWKNPMTPSGIKHATFRLVAQCLNQLRYQQRAPDYACIEMKTYYAKWLTKCPLRLSSNCILSNKLTNNMQQFHKFIT